MYAMRSIVLGALFTAALTLATPSTCSAATVVQISAGPQDGGHDLSLLTLTPPPGPVGGPQNASNFALHDHGYLSPNLPDPLRAYVLFEFDEAVFVDSVSVVQHTNGITVLRHSYGDSAGGLLAGSISVSSTFGDVSGSSLMPEYTVDPFLFGGDGSGRFHKFFIDKTSNPAGWASYRFYLDFRAAGQPLPEPPSVLLLGVALLGLACRRRLFKGIARP